MNLIMVRHHHVIQGMILLVLDPFSRAGGFLYLVGGEAGSLGVRFTMDQVREIRRLIEGDGVFEVPPVHHGGVRKMPIRAGLEPS